MKIESINPRTGEIIKTFDEFPIEKVDGIVKQTKIAQEKWCKLPKDKRIEIIRKVLTILDQEKDLLADIVYQEAGFSQADTLGEITGDIIPGTETHIADYQKVKSLDYSNEDYRSGVNFIPQGVIGHIGIWNYPVWQTFITAIPALLTGNAVIYKISEYTTMTGLKITAIIRKAGVPEDVFIPLVGGPEIGKKLVKSNVDMIVFTGGSETGNNIIENAGTKPLLLELSGNDAGIVCDDCDLDMAVKGIAYGTFLHSGEVCTRVKRLFLTKKIADEFLKKYIDKVKSLKIGQEISPLIRDAARKKVEGQVQEAISQGAELLIGGKEPNIPGFYFEPTVLLYKDTEKKIYPNEIFGPVSLVQIVKDENEAVTLANKTNYGLGATIWCDDQNKAEKLAEKLDVGMVWINDSNVAIPGGVYYGGVKASGIATSQSRIMSFMKKKMIVANPRNEIRDWWY